MLVLLSDELARLLTTASDERQQVVNLAWAVYRKYSPRDYDNAERHVALAFEQMLRLVEFFELFWHADWPNALRSIEQQQLLPLEEAHVADASARFGSLADCVRSKFADILMAAMQVVRELYELARTSGARADVGGVEQQVRAADSTQRAKRFL